MKKKAKKKQPRKTFQKHEVGLGGKKDSFIGDFEIYMAAVRGARLDFLLSKYSPRNGLKLIECFNFMCLSLPPIDSNLP